MCVSVCVCLSVCMCVCVSFVHGGVGESQKGEVASERARAAWRAASADITGFMELSLCLLGRLGFGKQGLHPSRARAADVKGLKNEQRPCLPSPLGHRTCVQMLGSPGLTSSPRTHKSPRYAQQDMFQPRKLSQSVKPPAVLHWSPGSAAPGTTKSWVGSPACLLFHKVASVLEAVLGADHTHGPASAEEWSWWRP
jgi:hypothetical protein